LIQTFITINTTYHNNSLISLLFLVFVI